MSTLRKDLDELSGMLRHFHSALLHQTKQEYEEKTGTHPQPFELFNLVIHHADFQWMRPLSRLMATLDEMIDSKGPLSGHDLKQIDYSLMEMFNPLEPAYDEFRQGFSRISLEPRVAQTEHIWRNHLDYLRQTYLKDKLD